MTAKFLVTEIINVPVQTWRLGTTGARFTDADVGKAVKLSGDSAKVLCAAGDAIEGIVNSINVGVYDGYSIGGVQTTSFKSVTFDGSQAAGTGAIAVGDYVVCGTVVALGTSLSNAPFKVRKATDQAAAATAAYKARVVSLGTAGSGAVGTTGVIEFL